MRKRDIERAMAQIRQCARFEFQTDDGVVVLTFDEASLFMALLGDFVTEPIWEELAHFWLKLIATPPPWLLGKVRYDATMAILSCATLQSRARGYLCYPERTAIAALFSKMNLAREGPVHA